jgi:hypothetical protein
MPDVRSKVRVLCPNLTSRITYLSDTLTYVVILVEIEPVIGHVTFWLYHSSSKIGRNVRFSTLQYTVVRSCFKINPIQQIV